MTAPDDPTLADLAQQIEELGREVRRQGRAAVAAQAAAESCLEALEARDRSEDGERDELDDGVDRAWLGAIIPVADALDRVVAQAAMLARRRLPAPRRRLWPFGEPEALVDEDADALLQGLRVLRAQLDAALEARGAAAERRTGIPVDAEVHRVVEVRGESGDERVVEIVRPGYRLGERMVREAEVVVLRGSGGRRGA